MTKKEIAQEIKKRLAFAAYIYAAREEELKQETGDPGAFMEYDVRIFTIYGPDFDNPGQETHKAQMRYKSKEDELSLGCYMGEEKDHMGIKSIPGHKEEFIDYVAGWVEGLFTELAPQIEEEYRIDWLGD